MSSGSPFYPIPGISPDALLSPRKEICNYFSAYPIYSLAWSRLEDRNTMFRMALSSFLEEPVNKLQVVQLSPHHDSSQTPDRPDFGLVAETSVEYPLTKILWQPAKSGYAQTDLLAGTGDSLRIWDCERTGDPSEMGLYKSNLRLRAKLSTRADYAAPLTSFDWNQVDPRLIIASSIDTTCTVWDIETQQAKTQLIAHDREVFDVAFVAGSQDVFASAGADGSIRMFDLRSLEHSTILYETPPTVAPSSSDTHIVDSSYYSENAGAPAARMASFTPPLLRLSCNAIDPNYIATFALDSQVVNILDVRNPGSAVMQLVGHHAPISAITWSPSSPSQLCSAGADSRVLVWDIRQAVATRQHQQRQAAIAAAHAKQLSRLATGKDDLSDDQPLSPSTANSMQTSNAIQAVAQAAAAQALTQQPTQVAPCLTYAARLPVNSLAWHQNSADWVSIGFGNTVQTLRL
ncbi:hypothetical protein GGI12_001132 [Dipsacomyces acuminosporus]|nr:hypothetical protein GGI12_001132 [Dipsacomyces acuminosporus]